MILGANRVIVFSAASAGAVAMVVFLIWALSGFASLSAMGLSGNVLAALVLGVVFSTGLGIALMALVFYSDRTEQDEKVYHSFGLPQEPREGEPQ